MCEHGADVMCCAVMRGVPPSMHSASSSASSCWNIATVVVVVSSDVAHVEEVCPLDSRRI